MIEFKLINDLTFNTTYSKYVRDTVLSVSKNVDELSSFCTADYSIYYLIVHKVQHKVKHKKKRETDIHKIND